MTTIPTAAQSLTTTTRRLVLSAFTGAAFAGTAVTIASPSTAEPALVVSPDAWESVLLASFRGLNAHQKEAALGMVQSMTAPSPAEDTDAAFISICAQVEAVQRRINGKWTQGIGDAQYRCANYVEEDDERLFVEEPLEQDIDALLKKLEEIGYPRSLPAMHALARCVLLVDPDIRASATTDRRTMHHNPVQTETLLAWLLGSLTDGEITDATCMDAPGYLVREMAI